uniref:Uncharacterized protein n=1 Tax=Zea mays TaxID=4577 RepID=A0A804N4Q8_MAIZE
MIPTEEVIRVVVDEEGATLTAAVPLGPLMRVVERAKHELRVMCMVVPLRDTNEDDLLDRVEPCLDFIDEGIQFLYPLVVMYPRNFGAPRTLSSNHSLFHFQHWSGFNDQRWE